MNSSPSPTRGANRVLSAEDGRSLPLASLISPQLPPSLAAIFAEPIDEAALEAARKSGFEAGYEEGLATAHDREAEARRALLERSAASLLQAAQAIGAMRKAILDEVLSDCVELVMGVLAEMLGQELALAESPARDAILRALELAPPDEELVVRVHPDNEFLSSEFQELLGEGRQLTFRSDPSIEATGAVVDVGACHIDAQIGPALERVRAALCKHLDRGPCH